MYKYLPNSPIRQTQLNCVSTKYVQVSAHQSQLNCGDTKYVRVPTHLANPPITIKLWGKKYVQRMSADLGNSPITIKLWNESVPDFAAWIVPAWTVTDYLSTVNHKRIFPPRLEDLYLKPFFCTHPVSCDTIMRPKIGWFKSAALPATPTDAIYGAIL